MKVISNPEKVKKVYEANGIGDMFDSRDIDFFLVKYKKGELIRHPAIENDWFQISVSGAVRIYNIRSDGTLFQFAAGEGRHTIGKIEAFSDLPSPLYVEALTDVTTIAFSTSDNMDLLMHDLTFMKNTIHEFADLLMYTTANHTVPDPLPERTVNYMKHQCPNQTLHGVEKASRALQCSSRQLFRVLAELEKNKIVEKCGNGTYRLTDNQESSAERDSVPK